MLPQVGGACIYFVRLGDIAPCDKRDPGVFLPSPPLAQGKARAPVPKDSRQFLAEWYAVVPKDTVMRAFARKGSHRSPHTQIPRRTRAKHTSTPPTPPSSPPSPKLHFEAGWTDSWSHRRCMHKHKTLKEAAKCAMPTGCGWYVFAVEDDEPRELNEKEERIVHQFRLKQS
jgi:hypothetical protein